MPTKVYELENVRLANEIRRLRAENIELEFEVADLRNTLELIASSQRPDGSWNRDREACRQLAQEALDVDQ